MDIRLIAVLIFIITEVVANIILFLLINWTINSYKINQKHFNTKIKSMEFILKKSIIKKVIIVHSIVTIIAVITSRIDIATSSLMMFMLFGTMFKVNYYDRIK